MVSKILNLLLLLGLFTIAVSKSHNQRFIRSTFEHEFESQRTSPRTPSAIRRQMSERRRDFVFKLASNKKKTTPETIRSDYKSFLVLGDKEFPVDGVTSPIRKRTSRIDFEQQTEKEKLFPKIKDVGTHRINRKSDKDVEYYEDINPSATSVEIIPEDIYFEPLRTKSNMPRFNSARISKKSETNAHHHAMGFRQSEPRSQGYWLTSETHSEHIAVTEATSTQPEKKEEKLTNLSDDEKEQPDHVKKSQGKKKKKVRRKKSKKKNGNNYKTDKRLNSGDDSDDNLKTNSPQEIEGRPQIEENTQTKPRDASENVFMDKKNVPENYVLSFFRRIGMGDKIFGQHKTEMEPEKPEWMTMYETQNGSHTGEYFFSSFNYMGNKDNKAVDFRQVPDKNLIKKGNQKKAHAVSEKKLSQKKLEKHQQERDPTEEAEKYRDDSPIPATMDDTYDKVLSLEGDTYSTESDKSSDDDEDYFVRSFLKLGDNDDEPHMGFQKEDLKEIKIIPRKKEIKFIPRKEEIKFIPRKEEIKFIPRKEEIKTVPKTEEIKETKSFPRHGLHSQINFNEESDEHRDGSGEGKGKYFMHIYRRMGDLGSDDTEMQSGKKDVSDGYASSMKIRWDDDSTRAHVETVVEGRRKFPDQNHATVVNNRGLLKTGRKNTAGAEHFHNDDSEKLLESASENIFKIRSRYFTRFRRSSGVPSQGDLLPRVSPGTSLKVDEKRDLRRNRNCTKKSGTKSKNSPDAKNISRRDSEKTSNRSFFIRNADNLESAPKNNNTAENLEANNVTTNFKAQVTTRVPYKLAAPSARSNMNTTHGGTESSSQKQTLKPRNSVPSVTIRSFYVHNNSAINSEVNTNVTTNFKTHVTSRVPSKVTAPAARRIESNPLKQTPKGGNSVPSGKISSFYVDKNSDINSEGNDNATTVFKAQVTSRIPFRAAEPSARSNMNVAHDDIESSLQTQAPKARNSTPSGQIRSFYMKSQDPKQRSAIIKDSGVRDQVENLQNRFPFDKYEETPRERSYHQIFQSYQTPKRTPAQVTEIQFTTGRNAETGNKLIKKRHEKKDIKRLYLPISIISRINGSNKANMGQHVSASETSIITPSTYVNSSNSQKNESKSDVTDQKTNETISTNSEPKTVYNGTTKTENEGENLSESATEPKKDSKKLISYNLNEKYVPSGIPEHRQFFHKKVTPIMRTATAASSIKDDTKIPTYDHSRRPWLVSGKYAINKIPKVELQKTIADHLEKHSQESIDDQFKSSDKKIGTDGFHGGKSQDSSPKRSGHYISELSIPVTSENSYFNQNKWDKEFFDSKSKVDYPTYNTIPRTTFRCKHRIPGYYADPETRCQVFHMCHATGAKHSFLCPNSTIFNQHLLVCDWFNNVECEETDSSYESYENANSKESFYEKHKPSHDNYKKNEVGEGKPTWKWPLTTPDIKEYPAKDIIAKDYNSNTFSEHSLKKIEIPRSFDGPSHKSKDDDIDATIYHRDGFQAENDETGDIFNTPNHEFIHSTAVGDFGKYKKEDNSETERESDHEDVFPDRHRDQEKEDHSNDHTFLVLHNNQNFEGEDNDQIHHSRFPDTESNVGPTRILKNSWDQAELQHTLNPLSDINDNLKFVGENEHSEREHPKIIELSNTEQVNEHDANEFGDEQSTDSGLQYGVGFTHNSEHEQMNIDNSYKQHHSPDEISDLSSALQDNEHDTHEYKNTHSTDSGFQYGDKFLQNGKHEQLSIDHSYKSDPSTDDEQQHTRKVVKEYIVPHNAYISVNGGVKNGKFPEIRKQVNGNSMGSQKPHIIIPHTIHFIKGNHEPQVEDFASLVEDKGNVQNLVKYNIPEITSQPQTNFNLNQNQNEHETLIRNNYGDTNKNIFTLKDKDDHVVTRYIYPLPGITYNDPNTKGFSYRYNFEEPTKANSQGPKQNYGSDANIAKNNNQQNVSPVANIKLRISDVKSNVEKLTANAISMIENSKNSFTNGPNYRTTAQNQYKEEPEVHLSPFNFKKNDQSPNYNYYQSGQRPYGQTVKIGPLSNGKIGSSEDNVHQMEYQNTKDSSNSHIQNSKISDNEDGQILYYTVNINPNMHTKIELPENGYNKSPPTNVHSLDENHNGETKNSGFSGVRAYGQTVKIGPLADGKIDSNAKYGNGHVNYGTLQENLNVAPHSNNVGYNYMYKIDPPTQGNIKFTGTNQIRPTANFMQLKENYDSNSQNTGSHGTAGQKSYAHTVNSEPLAHGKIESNGKYGIGQVNHGILQENLNVAPHRNNAGYNYMYKIDSPTQGNIKFTGTDQIPNTGFMQLKENYDSNSQNTGSHGTAGPYAHTVNLEPLAHGKIESNGKYGIGHINHGTLQENLNIAPHSNNAGYDYMYKIGPLTQGTIKLRGTDQMRPTSDVIQLKENYESIGQNTGSHGTAEQKHYAHTDNLDSHVREREEPTSNGYKSHTVSYVPYLQNQNSDIQRPNGHTVMVGPLANRNVKLFPNGYKRKVIKYVPKKITNGLFQNAGDYGSQIQAEKVSPAAYGNQNGYGIRNSQNYEGNSQYLEPALKNGQRPYGQTIKIGPLANYNDNIKEFPIENPEPVYKPLKQVYIDVNSPSRQGDDRDQRSYVHAVKIGPLADVNSNMDGNRPFYSNRDRDAQTSLSYTQAQDQTSSTFNGNHNEGRSPVQEVQPHAYVVRVGPFPLTRVNPKGSPPKSARHGVFRQKGFVNGPLSYRSVGYPSINKKRNPSESNFSFKLNNPQNERLRAHQEDKDDSSIECEDISDESEELEKLELGKNGPHYDKIKLPPLPKDSTETNRNAILRGNTPSYDKSEGAEKIRCQLQSNINTEEGYSDVTSDKQRASDLGNHILQQGNFYNVKPSITPHINGYKTRPENGANTRSYSSNGNGLVHMSVAKEERQRVPGLGGRIPQYGTVYKDLKSLSIPVSSGYRTLPHSEVNTRSYVNKGNVFDAHVRSPVTEGELSVVDKAGIPDLVNHNHQDRNVYESPNNPHSNSYKTPGGLVRKHGPFENGRTHRSSFESHRKTEPTEHEYPTSQKTSHSNQNDDTPPGHQTTKHIDDHSDSETNGPLDESGDSKFIDRPKRVAHGRHSRYAELERAAELKAMEMMQNFKSHSE